MQRSCAWTKCPTAGPSLWAAEALQRPALRGCRKLLSPGRPACWEDGGQTGIQCLPNVAQPTFQDCALEEAVVEYALNHAELRGAFATHHLDADKRFPRWREKLGFALDIWGSPVELKPGVKIRLLGEDAGSTGVVIGEPEKGYVLVQCDVTFSTALLRVRDLVVLPSASAGTQTAPIRRRCCCGLVWGAAGSRPASESWRCGERRPTAFGLRRSQR